MPIHFAHSAGEGLRLARSAFFGSSLVLAGLAPALSAAKVEPPVDLATATSYAVLADGAITNNGNSVITGDVGVHPGTEISGFPPGVINGQRHAGDAVAERAQSDLTVAYNDAAGRTSSRTIGPHLEGQTLTPGVYKAAENASLAGTLTLDAKGNPSAVFIFQLGSGLTTAQNSNVRVVNSPRPACGVFWTVGDSATLGTNTSFVGRIMAVNGITLQSAAKIEQGGALSRDGSVTLDTNAVSRSECAAAGAPTRPPTAPASPTTPTPSQTVSPTTPGPTATTPRPTTPAPVTPGTTAPGTTAPGTTAPETGVPAPAVPEQTAPPPAAPAVPEQTAPPPAAPAVPELTAPPPAAPTLPELPVS
ncbi:ice-binding family protein [Micromonospora sp. RTP1Z1]|uniref:ice-binding family protein n=1 Tax=Micromonospora sp. RTP1Z1 TaxID=2994043 RepID=UPI0029C65872|nr:ice-binding family protein [Micromonospora sp. RTP1Z1]